MINRQNRTARIHVGGSPEGKAYHWTKYELEGQKASWGQNILRSMSDNIVVVCVFSLRLMFVNVLQLKFSVNTRT